MPSGLRSHPGTISPQPTSFPLAVSALQSLSLPHRAWSRGGKSKRAGAQLGRPAKRPKSRPSALLHRTPHTTARAPLISGQRRTSKDLARGSINLEAAHREKLQRPTRSISAPVRQFASPPATRGPTSPSTRGCSPQGSTALGRRARSPRGLNPLWQHVRRGHTEECTDLGPRRSGRDLPPQRQRHRGPRECGTAGWRCYENRSRRPRGFYFCSFVARSQVSEEQRDEGGFSESSG